MNRGPGELFHADFLEKVESSKRYVEMAANWLRSFGYEVRFLPNYVKPTYAETQKISDENDLEIQLPGDEAQRVEVKRLTTQFTGAHDWPYGEEVYGPAKRHWDNLKIKPAFLLTFSYDTRTVMYIDSKTEPHWWVKNVADMRRGGIRQETYVCPKKFVKFYEVPKPFCLDIPVRIFIPGASPFMEAV